MIHRDGGQKIPKSLVFSITWRDGGWRVSWQSMTEFNCSIERSRLLENTSMVLYLLLVEFGEILNSVAEYPVGGGASIGLYNIRGTQLQKCN